MRSPDKGGLTVYLNDLKLQVYVCLARGYMGVKKKTGSEKGVWHHNRLFFFMRLLDLYLLPIFFLNIIMINFR